MKALLVPAWDDPNVPLGPYVDADPETEVIRPRNLQLIPCKYASLIIHRRRVKAKTAYQEIVGAIRADGALSTCADVVTWLRAACTTRGGGGAQNAVPSVLHAFNPVHLPPEVYQYVTQKVQGDLPAVATAPGTGGPESAATIVGALRALTRGDGAGNGTRGGKEPKTIAEVYEETHRTLLRFCRVTEVDDVTPVWKLLANCHKSEQQYTLLTQELQRVCMSRGLSTQLNVPVVTTTVKQMIVGFQFPGHSADNLGTGCQPFLVAYAGKAHHHQVTAASSVADQLAQGDQNATLSDIHTIWEGEKLKFPLNVSEVCVTLYRYAVLCQVLFQGGGEKHSFVESMWDVATKFKNNEPFITDKYNELVSSRNITSVYYARIVRAVQVCAHEYFHQVAIHDTDDISSLTTPNFDGMLLELTRGTFSNSTNWIGIPAEYLGTGAMARPVTSIAPNAPASAGSTAPSTRSGQSNVSSLTGATPPVQNACVTNPAPDPEFSAITLRAGSSRPILREHPPPRNDSNREMCVAWWTRSACYQNCGHSATYRLFANAGKRTRLLGYIREHLAAPPADAGTCWHGSGQT